MYFNCSFCGCYSDDGDPNSFLCLNCIEWAFMYGIDVSKLARNISNSSDDEMKEVK